jgi:hypothetical protein
LDDAEIIRSILMIVFVDLVGVVVEGEVVGIA